VSVQGVGRPQLIRPRGTFDKVQTDKMAAVKKPRLPTPSRLSPFCKVVLHVERWPNDWPTPRILGLSRCNDVFYWL
jgi:hypothetical protein